MKCYYDILGIERNVPQDSIKKAYYKLSLKWHPDKNPDNSEEATEMFKELQKAYKVLSDVQERSWYDKNRERFMTMKFNSEDELYDLIHNAVYSGFESDEMGFYNVFEHIFSVLSERETEASRISGCRIDTIPSFGNSDSDYQSCVRPFYDFWQSFNTKMSFHWKNKHNIELDIPRDIRRLLEKENSDLRNTAKRNYNKEIQSFVDGIKLKDPRVKLWKEHLKDKAKDNEKKAINMKHKAWERSHKSIKVTEQVKTYGDMGVDELEDVLRSLELEHGKLGCESKNEDVEDLYCIACDKYFKSFASFSNHEKSKNHIKNLSMLRSQMNQEDDELFSEVIEEINNKSNEEINNKNNEKINEEINNKSKHEIEVEKVNKSNLSETLGKEDDLFNEVVQENVKEPLNDIDTIESDKNNLDEEEINNNKKSEKKRRRRPKPERDALKTELPKETVSVESSTSCDQCKTDFNTRNKLFQHLKSSGHSTLKVANKSKKK